MNVIEEARRNIQERQAASSAARKLFEEARDVLVEGGVKQGHGKYMVEDLGATGETPVYLRIQADPANPFRRNPANARRIDVIIEGVGSLIVRRKGHGETEAFRASEWRSGMYLENHLDGNSTYGDAEKINSARNAVGYVRRKLTRT